MAVYPVLIGGAWRDASFERSYEAVDPSTEEVLPGEYPVSRWEDIDAALDAAQAASAALRTVPPEALARFLEALAEAFEAHRDELAEWAHRETALPIAPRLRDVELPRTTDQLRQAAAAARDGSWTRAIIDTGRNLRSHHAPLGVVLVLGPNNFPFAYNGICGGDFAAAIASGNAVIAKAHPAHPGTTRLLGEQVALALAESGLPPAAVQLLYGCADEDGVRLVADPRLGATSFTGSRRAGLALKRAADAAGRLIYLEMSSLNPVVLLPGAVRERGQALVEEAAGSCLLGSGQFCTSPNILLLVKNAESEAFAEALGARFSQRPSSPLLTRGTLRALESKVEEFLEAGASVRARGTTPPEPGFFFPNTLLEIDGARLLARGFLLGEEPFGNASLLVSAADLDQARLILDSLGGNLTGSIYSGPGDDEAYEALAPVLRQKVGRLLNDRMPTGVAVSPAMNHGGPFPATAHPGFTAVGLPTSMVRFTALHCYDAVREHRLPAALRDSNPNGTMWRQIDGVWTREAVPAGS